MSFPSLYTSLPLQKENDDKMALAAIGEGHLNCWKNQRE